MGSFSATNDEKRDHISLDSQQVDTGAPLDASMHAPLDSGESLRLTVGKCEYAERYVMLIIERRRKIDHHILPLCSRCPNQCYLMALKQSIPSIILVPPSPGLLSTTADNVLF